MQLLELPLCAISAHSALLWIHDGMEAVSLFCVHDLFSTVLWPLLDLKLVEMGGVVAILCSEESFVDLVSGNSEYERWYCGRLHSV